MQVEFEVSTTPPVGDNLPAALKADILKSSESANPDVTAESAAIAGQTVLAGTQTQQTSAAPAATDKAVQGE